MKVRLSSPASATLAGVGVGRPEALPMSDGVECLAELEFDQNRLARMTSLAGGLIRSVEVDLGSQVSRGDLLATITAFFFLAMAFSAQMLPITIDLLFLRRGSRTGAAAGLIAGILTVCLFPPLGTLLLGEGSLLVSGTSRLKSLFDVGMCGLIINTLVFVLVSRFTRKPDRSHREAFARDLAGTR